MKRLLAISLAVVLALGLVAGDVMALTQPSVSLDDDIISATGEYTIMFTIAEDVAEGEYIIIAFPDDTDITDVELLSLSDALPYPLYPMFSLKAFYPMFSLKPFYPMFLRKPHLSDFTETPFI